jgi:hypothetical protein
METSNETKFDHFCAWYALNRDRFEFANRRRYDEMTSRLNGPKEFDYKIEPEDEYELLIVKYQDKGSHMHQFPVYFRNRFKAEGADVVRALANLGEAIDHLDKTLADALIMLVEFGEKPDDLRMTWHTSNTGRLLYIRAYRLDGLITVKAQVGEVP